MGNKIKVDGQWVSAGVNNQIGGTRQIKTKEQVQAIEEERNRKKLPIKTAQEFNPETFYSYNNVTKQAKFTKEGYNIEYYDDGKVKRIYSNPKEYTKDYSRRKSSSGKTKRRKEKGTYIPHEVHFDKTGMVTKEIQRADYESYDYNRDKKSGYERKVYDKSIKEYNSDGSLKSKKIYDDYESKEKRYDDGKREYREVYLKDDYNFTEGKRYSYNDPRTKKYDKRTSSLSSKTTSTKKSGIYSITVNGKTYNSSNKQWLENKYKEEYKKELDAKIGDPNKFVEDKVKAVLDKKENFRSLNNEYGNSIANEIIKIANIKNDAKNMTQADIDKIGSYLEKNKNVAIDSSLANAVTEKIIADNKKNNIKIDYSQAQSKLPKYEIEKIQQKKELEKWKDNNLIMKPSIEDTRNPFTKFVDYTDYHLGKTFNRAGTQGGTTGMFQGFNPVIDLKPAKKYLGDIDKAFKSGYGWMSDYNPNSKVDEKLTSPFRASHGVISATWKVATDVSSKFKETLDDAVGRKDWKSKEEKEKDETKRLEESKLKNIEKETEDKIKKLELIEDELNAMSPLDKYYNSKINNYNNLATEINNDIIVFKDETVNYLKTEQNKTRTQEEFDFLQNQINEINQTEVKKIEEPTLNKNIGSGFGVPAYLGYKFLNRRDGYYSSAEPWKINPKNVGKTVYDFFSYPMHWTPKGVVASFVGSNIETQGQTGKQLLVQASNKPAETASEFYVIGKAQHKLHGTTPQPSQIYQWYNKLRGKYRPEVIEVKGMPIEPRDLTYSRIADKDVINTATGQTGGVFRDMFVENPTTRKWKEQGTAGTEGFFGTPQTSSFKGVDTFRVGSFAYNAQRNPTLWTNQIKARIGKQGGLKLPIRSWTLDRPHTVLRESPTSFNKPTGNVKQYFENVAKQAKFEPIATVAPKTVRKYPQPEMELFNVVSKDTMANQLTKNVIGYDKFNRPVLELVSKGRPLSERFKSNLARRFESYKAWLNENKLYAWDTAQRAKIKWDALRKNKPSAEMFDNAGKAHEKGIYKIGEKLGVKNKPLLKAFAEVHDIQKEVVRNFETESAIATGVIKGYYDYIPSIKKLTKAEKKRLAGLITADTLPPLNWYNIKHRGADLWKKGRILSKEDKLIIMSDRLDRFGSRADPNMLWKMDGKLVNLDKFIPAKFGANNRGGVGLKIKKGNVWTKNSRNTRDRFKENFDNFKEYDMQAGSWERGGFDKVKNNYEFRKEASNYGYKAKNYNTRNYRYKNYKTNTYNNKGYSKYKNNYANKGYSKMNNNYNNNYKPNTNYRGSVNYRNNYPVNTRNYINPTYSPNIYPTGYMSNMQQQLLTNIYPKIITESVKGFDKRQPTDRKWKKKKFNKEVKSERGKVFRIEDPFMRWTGKSQYSDILTKLLRERYGNIHS